MLFGLLITSALLVAAGSSLGGVFAIAHTSLHDLFTRADCPPGDRTSQTIVHLPTESILEDKPVLLAVPTISSTITWTGQPALIPGAPCAAFHFQGTAHIQGNRLSFGRLNLVRNTSPYGIGDPLAWKLFQLESLTFSAEHATSNVPGIPLTATLPVQQAVGVLITDPFTQVPLLSARWQVNTIRVFGNRAGINAALEPNLSEIRINNAIESDTLASFAIDTADTADPVGILAIQFYCTEDIVSEIEANHPLVMMMNGTVHLRRCLD
jgi:hypothetical protein